MPCVLGAKRVGNVLVYRQAVDNGYVLGSGKINWS